MQEFLRGSLLWVGIGFCGRWEEYKQALKLIDVISSFVFVYRQHDPE